MYCEKLSVENTNYELSSFKCLMKCKKTDFVSEKSAKNDSDFEPADASEEDDFSIPESENASWDSGARSGKRGAAKRSRHVRKAAANQRMAAHNANLKRQAIAAGSDEDDRELFEDMPRQRLSRRCKTAASKTMFHEFDEIPSSSSPEEFDERIHVRTKAEKLRLEMEAARKAATGQDTAANTQVKVEPVENKDIPAVKAEPNAQAHEQITSAVVTNAKTTESEENLDVSMNTEGGEGEHMQEDKQ